MSRGAVRLIWPGVTEDSAGVDHPLWFADAQAQRIYGQISSRVVTAGLAHAKEDPRILNIERRRRQSESRALAASLEQMRTQLDEGQLEAAEITAQLRDAEDRVNTLATDRDTWADMAAELDAQSSELNRDLLNARAERDHWKAAAQNA